jgi:hypothetical protein
MIAVLFAVIVLLVALLVLQGVVHQHDLRGARASYEYGLEVERRRVDELLTQVQANSQGFQHYPQIGPSGPAAPEPRYFTDETGLIVAAEEDLTEHDQFEADLQALGFPVN